MTLNLVNINLYRKRFIRANDPSEYVQVCTDSNIVKIWNVLIPFLDMVKTFLQSHLQDTELIYVYTKTSKFTDLENFVTGPNVFNIHGIGDKGFNEELRGPFKIIFYEYQQ